MKRLLILMIGLMFLFSFNFITAQPPFQQSDITTGLVIETGYPTNHIIDEDYYIHGHIYNATNGLLVTEGLNCYYHFYNHQINGGEHIDIGLMTQYGSGYNATVNGSLINETGEYSALIWCNSTDAGGFFKYTFDVIDIEEIEEEKTGVFALNLSDNYNLFIMGILFILSVLAFIIKRVEISSLIMIILGFFMLTNDVNMIASSVVICLGVIIAFMGGGD